MIDEPEPHPLTPQEAELLDMMARKMDAMSKRHNGVWHNEPRRPDGRFGDEEAA